MKRRITAREDRSTRDPWWYSPDVAKPPRCRRRTYYPEGYRTECLHYDETWRRCYHKFPVRDRTFELRIAILRNPLSTCRVLGILPARSK